MGLNGARKIARMNEPCFLLRAWCTASEDGNTCCGEIKRLGGFAQRELCAHATRHHCLAKELAQLELGSPAGAMARGDQTRTHFVQVGPHPIDQGLEQWTFEMK